MKEIMDIDDIKISPSPFCGGDGHICTDTDSNGNEFKIVECKNCQALGSPSDCYLSYETDIDLIKESISAANNWNKRQ